MSFKECLIICCYLVVVAAILYQQYFREMGSVRTGQSQKQAMGATEGKLSDTMMWKKSLEDVMDGLYELSSVKKSTDYLTLYTEQLALDVSSLKQEQLYVSKLNEIVTNLKNKLQELSSKSSIPRTELSSVKKSTDDLSLQIKNLTVVTEALKKSFHDVDARVKDINGKLKRMEAADDKFRQKMREFKEEIRKYAERNPIWDAISRIFMWFIGRRPLD